MYKLFNVLNYYKYEFLLIGLIQHLFIAILLNDLDYYTRVIWPINMVVLGICSSGFFAEKNIKVKIVKNTLLTLVIVFPVFLPMASYEFFYLTVLNIVYLIFFVFVFIEILKFLIRPGYIDADIISASACGYFLLIEISTFLFQGIYHNSPLSMQGINGHNMADVYIDLVYFSSVTLTSIGYGDITPSSHETKLLASIFGIGGQFYSVVLVGILISKFVSKQEL